VLEAAHQGILGQVLGARSLAGQPPEEGAQRGLVAPRQLAIGVRIPGGAGQGGQLGIGQARQASLPAGQG
jgi:hypothetical protein